jgi:hypothetical protein
MANEEADPDLDGGKSVIVDHDAPEFADLYIAPRVPRYSQFGRVGWRAKVQIGRGAAPVLVGVHCAPPSVER